MTDLVEIAAAAMWKADAARAASNTARYRTLLTFREQSEGLQERWKGLARAALAAVDAAQPKSSVAPLRLSSGGPDQRPILGQRGVGLRAEPEVLELHTVDREEPIRVAVHDGEGFCRKCGAPMAEGIATGQTFTPGSPDFPGSDVVTMSAGGPGAVIRALKCTACGWSVTA